MLTEHIYWKLNDVVDYENFMRQAAKEDCIWLGGQEPENEVLRRIAINGDFPQYIEIEPNENQNIISFVSADKAKKAYDYKAYTFRPINEDSSARKIPNTESLTALSFKDENGRTLNFTEEGVRKNLDNLIETIRKRFSVLRLGDKVRIVDPGCCYSTYHDWFKENKVNYEYATRYAYGQDVEKFKDKVGTIVAMGKHTTGNLMIYAVEFPFNWNGSPVYLINEEEGVEKA